MTLETLVSSDGREALLRDASIRWGVWGQESCFQGDVSIVCGGGDGGEAGLFVLRCFGQRVRWVDQADGSQQKEVDDNLVSVGIGLPTDCAEMWKVFPSKKFKGRTTRAVCHLIHFPSNKAGLQHIQITVEVYDRDTTPSDLFQAALTFAKLETYAETLGQGNPKFRKHPLYCECRLCERQALRNT